MVTLVNQFPPQDYPVMKLKLKFVEMSYYNENWGHTKKTGRTKTGENWGHITYLPYFFKLTKWAIQ